MSWYSDNIRITAVEAAGSGLAVTAWTGHVGKVLQCYRAGRLADWQRPVGGVARFVLPGASPAEPLLLLAVDPGEQQADYWGEAFPHGSGAAGRIEVRLRRDLFDGRLPGDRWRVWLGPAGGAAADRLVHEAELFPGGRGACGWGMDWGGGGWGFSGSNAPGWGSGWGERWGFDIDHLAFTTECLPRGVYPVKVDLLDAHGNASEPFETTVAIDTFARPAAEPAVTSYDPSTDTLVLSFTPSPDC